MATERSLLGYGLFLFGLAVSYQKGFGSRPKPKPKSKPGSEDEPETRLLRMPEFRHRLWWVLGSLVMIGAGLYLMAA